MPFDVIPAIDLWQGRLARMGEEGGLPLEAYDGDPLAAAEAFTFAGARWLHVVDLDLAFTGEPGNLQTISLLAVMDAHIQASGGIASEEHVLATLAAGAERVVLGSAALADRPLVERLATRYGDAVAIALETVGHTIRPRGRNDLIFPLGETLEWLANVRASRFVHVAVDRVGALAGPDLKGVFRVADAVEAPVIASGGISTTDDDRALAELGPYVQGAILGRSLYEGELDLREAIRVAAGSHL